jgi:glycosyltransferase involved in cell wall biosynthesis
MKILLVHNFYQQFGGEDAVAGAEKRLLEDHRDEVVTYTRHNNEIKEYNFYEKTSFTLQTIFSSRTNKEITEIIRKFSPDVAYIHNVFPLISPSLYYTLHALGVPTVQVIHNFRLLCPNGWFYTQGQVCERCKYGNYLNAVRYRCYRESHLLSALYAAAIGIGRVTGVMEKISAFVCLTEFSKQKLLEIKVPEEKIFVRPNYVDATATTPQPGRGKHVVYLGRLSIEKGIWTLIQAFEQLKDVALKIVGTGPLEASLKSYVQERGLTNVSFLGFRQGQDKWEILKNSLCTIVPSEWYENFPVVVLEAYAAAKPVIGSNLGSLPYVVEDGKSGLLFEPGNVSDLAEKVRSLLARPAERERMGKYCRTLVESKYNPERSYETLKTIFTQVQRKQ